MRSSTKYSDQLILNFFPPLWDHLMVLRDHEDRLISQRNYFFPSLRSLYREKPYLEFHLLDPSYKISRDTPTYMGHDILYPSHLDLLESITLLSARGRPHSVGVVKEVEVIAFSSPVSIGIGSFRFDVGGIDRESEVFLLDEAKSLGNKINNDFERISSPSLCIK